MQIFLYLQQIYLIQSNLDLILQRNHLVSLATQREIEEQGLAHEKAGSG